MAAHSTEKFLDVSATDSTQQFLDTIVTKSDTALESIATFIDAFVDNTVQNSTEPYFNINATNITEEVLDIIGVKPYEQFFDVISACMLVIVALVGTTGNFKVCNIVYSNKELRTSANIQLVSLAITDLLVCILTSSLRFSLTVKSLLYGEINIKGPFCTSQIFIFYFPTVTTIVSLGAISVSRAIVVADKFTPRTKKMVTICSITVCWTTGFGYATWKAWAGEDLSCNLEPIGQEVKTATRGGVIIVFLTLCTMVVSYSYIYRVINRHEKSFQRAMKAAGSGQQSQRKPMDLSTLK
uniref:Melanopsin-like n=1 Tax=Saccoglossus kowalevskii TaxID=10224 RepID=A0ABM0MYG7_SACKO